MTLMGKETSAHSNQTKDKRIVAFLHGRSSEILMQLKYLFTLFLIFLSLKTSRDFSYVLFGVLELILIFLFSEILLKKNRIAAYILNSFFLLLVNIQFGMLLFSGTFIQPVMLSNVLSVQMLRGKMVKY